MSPQRFSTGLVEAAGAELTDWNGGGPGVRFRKLPRVKNHK